MLLNETRSGIERWKSNPHRRWQTRRHPTQFLTTSPQANRKEPLSRLPGCAVVEGDKITVPSDKNYLKTYAQARKGSPLSGGPGARAGLPVGIWDVLRLRF